MLHLPLVVGNKKCYICINPKGTNYHPRCFIVSQFSITLYIIARNKFKVNVQFYTLHGNHFKWNIEGSKLLKCSLFFNWQTTQVKKNFIVRHLLFEILWGDIKPVGRYKNSIISTKFVIFTLLFSTVSVLWGMSNIPC